MTTQASIEAAQASLTSALSVADAERKAAKTAQEYTESSRQRTDAYITEKTTRAVVMGTLGPKLTAAYIVTRQDQLTSYLELAVQVLRHPITGIKQTDTGYNVSEAGATQKALDNVLGRFPLLNTRRGAYDLNDGTATDALTYALISEQSDPVSFAKQNILVAPDSLTAEDSDRLFALEGYLSADVRGLL